MPNINYEILTVKKRRAILIRFTSRLKRNRTLVAVFKSDGFLVNIVEL